MGWQVWILTWSAPIGAGGQRASAFSHSPPPLWHQASGKMIGFYDLNCGRNGSAAEAK
jgi:hypothetical protein